MADARAHPAAIGVYGVGGDAREFAWMLARPPVGRVIAFVDEAASPAQQHAGPPALTLGELAGHYPGTPIIPGVGSPATRRQLADRCASVGAPCTGVSDASVVASEAVNVDPTCVIAPSSILTVDVTLAAHVHINLLCSVSHDVRLGAFCACARVSPALRAPARAATHARGRAALGCALAFFAPIQWCTDGDCFDESGGVMPGQSLSGLVVTDSASSPAEQISVALAIVGPTVPSLGLPGTSGNTAPVIVLALPQP